MRINQALALFLVAFLMTPNASYAARPATPRPPKWGPDIQRMVAELQANPRWSSQCRDRVNEGETPAGNIPYSLRDELLFSSNEMTVLEYSYRGHGCDSGNISHNVRRRSPLAIEFFGGFELSILARTLPNPHTHYMSRSLSDIIGLPFSKTNLAFFRFGKFSRYEMLFEDDSVRSWTSHRECMSKAFGVDPAKSVWLDLTVACGYSSEEFPRYNRLGDYDFNNHSLTLYRMREGIDGEAIKISLEDAPLKFHPLAVQ